MEVELKQTILLLVFSSLVISAAGSDPGLFGDQEAGLGCSSIWMMNKGHPFHGANLDHFQVKDGYVFINKRGQEKTGLWPGTTGDYGHWVARYASLTFSLVAFEMFA